MSILFIPTIHTHMLRNPLTLLETSLGIYLEHLLSQMPSLGRKNSNNGHNGLGIDTTARLNQAFETAVSEKRVPCITTAVLNKDGSIIFKRSWGTTNIEDPSSPPITPSTKCG